MSKSRWRFPHQLLFIPPVLIGVAVLAYSVRNRNAPEREEGDQEVARVLRVIQAPETEVLPRAMAYGTAEPGKVWQAVAEVKGRVVEVHEDLKPGAILKQGAVVLKIDPNETTLTSARLEAEVEQVKAQVEELAAQKNNNQASLKIEQDSLMLAEKELNRLQDLQKRNATAASNVEQQQRNVLAQRQSVQTLENALSLYPSESKALQASLAIKQAQLSQAQLDLAKTVIEAPFDCRVGPVSIEVGQFLAAGQVLFESHNVDSVEVEAQVSPRDIRKMLQRPDDRTVFSFDMKTMRDVFKLDAVVRFGEGEGRVEWPAKFDRVRENLDPNTRTVGIVFSIDDPYRRAIPGKQPPPLPGTFCEVELRSQKKLLRVIVPRTAVHNRHVYVVNAENRLERREVQIGFAQAEFLALEKGLAAGETVVVSDPTPAVVNMLVKPTPDEALVKRLVDAAGGQGGVR